MGALKFFVGLALLQLPHALVVAALDPAQEWRARKMITAAIIIDALVVLSLLI